MKYFPLLWATLWRKKARTLFTLASMIIAFLLFGMLQGVNAAFIESVERANVNRLIVTSNISLTEMLPMSQLAQIESVPGVAVVAYASWFGSWYQEPKNFVFAQPVDIDRHVRAVPEMVIAPAHVDALKRVRDGLIVGVELMNKNRWKIGERIPLNSTIWAKQDGSSTWSFEIVGTYDVPSDRAQTNGALFNHSYFDEGRALAKSRVGWWVIQVRDPNDSARVAAAVDARFANSPDETKTQSEKEFSASFLKQFGDINFIANSILGAVFFTLLFLTGNTMMQSVRERIPELAVLKTLGFSDTRVTLLVLAESLLLCLTAAVAGLAIARALFPLLKDVIGVVQLPNSVIASGLLVAVVLALATGGVPAWRAKRLVIVDALAGR